MGKMMKALVETGSGKGIMEIMEIDLPSPKNDEILIKVKLAGICGSDIHVFNWESHVNLQLPVVVGHEFSGE